MKHIIVASDLSDRSEQAMRRAVTLAIRHTARLGVHYVVDSAMPLAIAEDVKFQAQSALEKQVAAYAASSGITYDVQVSIGDVISEMTHAIRDSDPDLLIVGVHRRRLFLDQIKETTMERLIKTSRVPVLLIAGPADTDYNHVLAAVDLSRACESAIRHAQRIAPQAKMSLFHAHEVSFHKESRRDYVTWKADATLPPDLPEPMLIEGKPSDAIHDLMASNGYDLLALGAHTRSNLSRFVLGGFTAGLIRNPPCDVLVAK